MDRSLTQGEAVEGRGRVACTTCKVVMPGACAVLLLQLKQAAAHDAQKLLHPAYGNVCLRALGTLHVCFDRNIAFFGRLGCMRSVCQLV
jgi:hypothetical protein